MDVILLIVITMALAEIIKGLKIINSKFIPVINLAIGICMSVAYSSSDLKTSISKGLIIGFTASGLYSGIKNFVQGIKNNNHSKD